MARVGNDFCPTKGICEEVTQGTLTPSFGGSNPSSPAIWGIGAIGERVRLITDWFEVQVLDVPPSASFHGGTSFLKNDGSERREVPSG